MRRHIHSSLSSNSILAPPQTRHSLGLRVKVQTGLSVESARAATSNTLLVSGERKHGERHGDGYVNTNLAGLDVALEAGGGCARVGEDGYTVAVFVAIDQVDGVFEGVDVDGDEDGAEDFFFVAGHVGLDVSDQSWADLGWYC